MFQLPQISYSSTSSELSNRDRYRFFSRVVPPDNLQVTSSSLPDATKKAQAKAIVDLIKKLSWSYVFVVQQDDAYGNGLMEAFKKFAEEVGM